MYTTLLELFQTALILKLSCHFCVCYTTWLDYNYIRSLTVKFVRGYCRLRLKMKGIFILGDEYCLMDCTRLVQTRIIIYVFMKHVPDEGLVARPVHLQNIALNYICTRQNLIGLAISAGVTWRVNAFGSSIIFHAENILPEQRHEQRDCPHYILLQFR